MRKILFPIFAVLIIGVSQLLTSCLDGNEGTDYSDWRKANEKFFAEQAERLDEDGNLYYERYSPEWAKGITLLIRRHNQSPAGAMRPMDNSLCDVVYQGRLYNETVFDSSYSKKDSVYQCQPMSNITGFWAALTTMAAGDSVTVVIPANAAYGENGTTGINPYSTLIFELKLKKIASWDSPMK